MSKADLIDAISEKVEVSKADIGRVFDALTDHIVVQLQNGERVPLDKIGILEVTNRAARKGRNPKTGEEIDIAASRSAKLKVSKKLKDALQD